MPMKIKKKNEIQNLFKERKRKVEKEKWVFANEVEPRGDRA